jgi:RNA polymerase sigma factor (sigma-70 family)
MSDTSTVTEWIDRLKEGDESSGQRLWTRYVDTLIRLARSKLGQAPRRDCDEEDVVISAFDSFFRGIERGRFPRLEDRSDLWQILVMLTERKAVNQRRRQLAKKRGGGQVLGESALAGLDDSAYGPRGIEAVVSGEPTPEFAAEVAEQVQRLLTELSDEQLQQIALAKLEGYTNHEIAERLDLTVRTVERRLSLIRRIWREDE